MGHAGRMDPCLTTVLQYMLSGTFAAYVERTAWNRCPTAPAYPPHRGSYRLRSLFIETRLEGRMAFIGRIPWQTVEIRVYTGSCKLYRDA